jgi:hypothetical protein
LIATSAEEPFVLTEIVPFVEPVEIERTPELVIVTLSLVASPATKIPVPAAISKVSFLASAAIVLDPTFIFEKAFWFTSAPAAMLLSLLFAAVV